jgi:hypothetical protein
MRITICGSIAFYKEMLKTKEELEELGHEVKLPPSELKDEKGNLISCEEYYRLRKAERVGDDSWIWDRKTEMINDHFKKIEWSDAILVLNHEKKGIKGYVGGNTLIEMGVAFYLKKRIFLFDVIPEISYTEEILGMKPILIDENLGKIE